MKKLKSKLTALALFVGVLSGFGLELVGCSPQQEKLPIVDGGGSQTNPGTDKDNPSTNPGQDKEDPSKNPPVVTPPEETPAEKLARGVEKFDAFVDKLIEGRNFAYSQSGLGKNVLAEIDQTKAKLTEDGQVTYFEESEGQNFSYVWNDKIGLWEKDFSETNTNTLISSLQSALDGIRWGIYDEKNQFLGGIGKLNFGGTAVDTSVQVDLSSEGEMKATIGAGNQTITMDVNKIGEVDVTLPAKEQVSDKTVPSENVYEIVNGQRQWNIKLLADIFDKWMKGDNQYHNDYFNQFSKDLRYLQFVYANPSDKNFQIGVVIEDISSKECMLTTLGFAKEDFYNKLKDGSLQTKDAFLNYLNSTKQKDLPLGNYTVIEYSTDTATAEQKKQFEAMTKNVFDRLETVGLQGNSVNNPGDRTSKFANAKVLFGFKTPNSHTVAGADLGNRQDWNQYYLLECDGKLEFVRFNVSASVDGVGTAIEKVVNNVSNSWKVGFCEEKGLDAGNKDLYNTYWYVHTKDKEK